MWKYKPIEFQFNLEIERIARRFRKEQRNSTVAVAIDDLQVIRNLNSQGGIEPVNVEGGQEGQNGQIIYGQPGNNNIIYMADDRDRAIIDYAVLTPQVINSGIVRLEVQTDNFELKPVMFQMLQTMRQFNRLSYEVPHLHLKLFFKVSDAFKIIGASQKALRLKFVSFSLRDRARVWFNSLPLDSITTWNDLPDKFFMKYFPLTKIQN